MDGTAIFLYDHVGAKVCNSVTFVVADVTVYNFITIIYDIHNYVDDYDDYYDDFFMITWRE